MKVLALGAAAALSFLCAAGAQASESFAISFPAVRSTAPLDGRVILMLSKNAKTEPRDQVSGDEPLGNPDIFGVTVDGLKPGEAAIVDASAFGWPARSLAGVKAGDYIVQAVLNRYETYRRADGSVVKLPPDKGEGQDWSNKPGNLYSRPFKIHVDPAHPARVKIVLDQVMPAIKPKADTEFVRHVMIQSALLTRFWGRPTYIGAHVLLPWGFDKHPNAHFPLMVFHGHFPDDISGFRTTPPDPNLKPDYSERFHLAGYNRIQQQEAYAFYKKWISPGFPRFIVIEIEHANPYYDDSYAVNSANLGPYGDAINHELIPYIEKKFRGLGQGWARFTYGGSTGGWEALATQVFYPDMYNGTFAACPDPIDFHAYGTINIYSDKNAYAMTGQALSVEKPSIRNYLGEVFATQRDSNYQEYVLGDHGRSGGQDDIWQAVFGPEGADGYPKRLFDKVSGAIDPTVAAYWREHYDLTHIIDRDWKTLGPKLAGKIHIYVGSADTYYLNDAVYYAQATLEKLKNPAYGGQVDYGDRAEHCWNGDHKLPNAYSRLHYNTFYLPKILARIKATAPKGADLTSWRY
ncbi:MAG: alpha/beta hydrolase-fold protein [Rhizomicrobium sp.]